MKQTRDKILSLFLALLMCLSLLPGTALAAGGDSGEPALFLDPIRRTRQAALSAWGVLCVGGLVSGYDFPNNHYCPCQP